MCDPTTDEQDLPVPAQDMADGYVDSSANLFYRQIPERATNPDRFRPVMFVSPRAGQLTPPTEHARLTREFDRWSLGGTISGKDVGSIRRWVHDMAAAIARTQAAASNGEPK